MTNDTSIKVGDVVRLKCGGPNMTVAKVESQEDRNDIQTVVCIWFDCSNGVFYGAPHREVFTRGSLQLSPAKDERGDA